jgi:predicted protein tyrosine phosphatase
MIILPIQLAKQAVEKFPKKLNVISVERTDFVDKNLCKNHLHIPIDDLDPVRDGETLPSPYTYATKQDILKIIDFAKKHKVHIIHCHAGISRSTAVAYAIFRSQGMNKEKALREINKLNPYAQPNELIVRLTDEIFK